MTWNIDLDFIIYMITFKLYLLFYLPWLAKSCIYRSRILKRNKTASKFSVFMCTSRLLKAIIWVFWMNPVFPFLRLNSFRVSEIWSFKRCPNAFTEFLEDNPEVLAQALTYLRVYAWYIYHTHTNTNAYMFLIA